MAGTAAALRLQEERKLWRKDHPPGFVAKPELKPDGTTDLFIWKCVVPGKDGTIAEGALIPVTIKFSDDHPARAPRAFLPKGFFHVNIFDYGGVCLSVLKDVVPTHLGDVSGWRPSFTVKTILLAIQELLHVPNFGSIANFEVANLKATSEAQYLRRIKAEFAKYVAINNE